MGDQQTVRRRRWWRSAHAYAVLTAVVGVSGSLAGAAVLANADREAGHQATSGRVELARRAVTDELQRYLDTIRLVAASAGTQPALSRDTYLELTRPLADAKLVGAAHVAYLVPATDEQVGAVQRQWRLRGVPDLRLHPEGSAREHFFTVFDRALDDAGAPATGVDTSQSAEPAAALAESRRSGVATLSRPYVPLRDRGLPADRRQLSFALAAPVLGPSNASGARPFLGWILIELRGPALLDTILRDPTEDVRTAALYATDANGHDIRVAALNRGPTGRSDLRQEAAIPAAQQIWTLRATVASPGINDAPLWVAGGGSMLAVAVAVLVGALITVRDRARIRVTHTTGQLEADLATRKIIEAQLHHSHRALTDQQNYFAALLDSLDIVVVACDNDGEVTLKNAYSRQLGGPATLTHLDGTPLRDDELPLGRALREGRVDGIEVLYQGSDQRPRTMIVHGQALSASDGSRIGAVMTGYDITELRDHERELAGFATIAAHDLKAPLAVIAAYTELLAADSTGSTGEAAELLERINAGVGRMRALIDDLLAYASARDAVLDSVDVVLRQVVADVVTARTDHLRLTPDERFPDIYVGPLPAVHADEAMVRQLVDNLVGNALKYVHPGEAARVDITGTEDDGWVRVEIADRGIGIPAAERAAVFNPFHRVQTDHPYGGTGLGLAICQRIVDRHGGQIGVTANLGGGSRFFFTLPAASRSPDRPAAARVSTPGPLASAA